MGARAALALAGLAGIFLGARCVEGRPKISFSSANQETYGQTVGNYANAANTVYFSVYGGVRCEQVGVDAAGKPVLGRWSFFQQPLAALYAFANGAVIDPPAQYAPFNIHFHMVDACYNDTLKGDTVTLRAMTDIMMGKGARPPVQGLIGGGVETPTIARQASALQVPDIGFFAGSESLSDKTAYPFYMRSNPPDGRLWYVATLLLSQMKYTKVMVWHSTSAEGLAVKDAMVQYGGQSGLTVGITEIAPGSNIGLPPDPGSAMEETWNRMVTNAQAFNAHTHINGLANDVPGADVMTWLWCNGLVGSGHWWIGWQLQVDLYHNAYLYATQYLWPKLGKHMGSFPYATPLDGYLTIAPTPIGPRYRSTFVPWWKSLGGNTTRLQEIFGFTANFGPNLFTDPDSSLAQPISNFMFDATITLLLAANKMMLQYGKNFTGKQLLSTMLASDFDGLSGRVRFMANGDRLVPYELLIYHRCAALGLPVPSSSRRLQEERRRSREPAAAAEEPAAPLFEVLSPIGPGEGSKARELQGCLEDEDCLLRMLAEAVPAAAGNATADNATVVASAGGVLTTTVVLQGDYASLVGGRKLQFLLECSTKLTPVTCIDVNAGSIVVTVRGASSELAFVDKTLQQGAGLTLPSFGYMLLAPTTTTTTELPFPLWGYARGYPRPGEQLSVGRYENSNLTFSVPLFFYGCSTSAPPDQDLLCSAGTFYNRTSATCTTCPAGTYTLEKGQSACALCGKGTYSAVPGRSQCTACAAGAFAAEERSTACEPCASGTFQGDIQQSFCLECEEGRYTDAPGGSECVSCETGKYAGGKMMTGCTPCPSGRSTWTPGSTGPQDCRCTEGTYSLDNVSECMACEAGMVCPFGSNLQNWFRRDSLTASMSEEEKAHPLLAPKYWSDPDEPLGVFECRSAYRCPGGDPGACSDRMSHRSCEYCDFGYNWDGTKCVGCSVSEQSRWLFPVLPSFLMPLVVLYLYYSGAGGFKTWSSWQNNCQTLLFVLLNFYQVLNLMGSAKLVFPPTVDTVMRIWQISNDMISPFKISCQGFVGFGYLMVSRILVPVLLALWCIFLYLGSRVAALLRRRDAHRIRLDGNRLFNVYMGIIYTFFNGIAALSLSLFKCQGNPNGKSTLSADLSVICYQDGLWMRLLGVAVGAVFVYCVGASLLFIYIIVRALTQFANPSFQLRWKFLFIRYRVDVWWWSMIFLLKNVLFNLAFVVFTEAIAQLYFMMAALTAYAFGVVVFKPYRYMLANTFEVFITVVLIFIASMLTNFCDKSTGSTETILSTTCAVIAFVPILLTALMLLVVVYRGYVQTQKGYDKEQQRIALRVRDAAFTLFRLNDEQMWRFIRETIGEADRSEIQKLVTLVEAEVKGAAHARIVSAVARAPPPSSRSASSGAVSSQGQHSKEKEGAISGEIGGSTAMSTLDLVGQGATLCKLRMPVPGEVVYLHTESLQTNVDDAGDFAWSMSQGQVAEVVEVRADGQMKLVKNGVLSTWVDRAPFAYNAPAWPSAAHTVDNVAMVKV